MVDRPQKITRVLGIACETSEKRLEFLGTVVRPQKKITRVLENGCKALLEFLETVVRPQKNIRVLGNGCKTSGKIQEFLKTLLRLQKK